MEEGEGERWTDQPFRGIGASSVQEIENVFGVALEILVLDEQAHAARDTTHTCVQNAYICL